jgi:hypothetical protein
MLVDFYVARRTDLDGFGTTRIANRYLGICGSRSAPVEGWSGAATSYGESYVGVVGLQIYRCSFISVC